MKALFLRSSFIFAGLSVLILTDGSGQDARFYGRRADHEFLAKGRMREALKLYQQGYRAAVAAADPVFQYRFLNNIGACQVKLFLYDEAEQTLVQVRKLAEAAHDDQTLASADGNLAAVYVQLDDMPSAEVYARESLEAFSRTAGRPQRARATMTLAQILSREKLTREAETFFRAGIGDSTGLQDWKAASEGWLHYGSALLKDGQLEAADRALANSYSMLHKTGGTNGEDGILWKLSELRLRQGNFRQALTLVNSAIRVLPPSGGSEAPRRLYQTRAKVELATGDVAAALRDARAALPLARSRRAAIAPSGDRRVKIDGVLDEVFSILIEAGNRVYAATGDPSLARETFEAAEENRAESLQAVVPAAGNRQVGGSTPEYRERLSQLLFQQRVALCVNSREARDRVARLRAELAQASTNTIPTVGLPGGTILDRVRKNLPPGSALLSFRLGDGSSWLWAVNRGSLQIYRLPPKDLLLGEISEFQNAIRDNDTRRIARIGRRLYRDLFGGSQRSYQQDSQWFVSLDEPLYTLALPSLVVEIKGRRPVYLTERKTLLVLPGAHLFDVPDRGALREGRFVLAGDGIYNRADPRFGKSGFGRASFVPVGRIRPASWGMARLPGSGAEVRFAADLWRHATLLTGAQMTRETLLREIDRDPDMIHIASHVIEDQDPWHSGILALGMDHAGEPDFLTAQEIQLHPMHTRLVVMTGCSSGSGDTPPAAGLMGLTRAWLAAGAGEVLATRWPTMDESGDGLIGGFYRHLLASPNGDIPEALRAARRDLIARGGWRAEPRYWSSFFLIGVR